jgi:2-polyprenyl-3-methyl-5-hydroxy-6-metoxy-1,4-benzoquinol methylase
MKSLEESIVYSMDGSEIEIYPFLTYILQDLWEIGTNPEVIIELIRNNANNYSMLKILDLGCGKGAVSINLSKEFKCRCYGFDAVKEFIEEAKNRAKEHNVDHLCQFEVDDIRKRVSTLSQFDFIILGSIGPVFGNYFSTCSILSRCLKPNGILIIDDGYQKDEDYNANIPTKGVILQQISKAGMILIDELINKKEDIISLNNHILEKITKRCNELINKHPNKRSFFENYITKQKEENYLLETKIVCSVMAFRKK